MATTLQNLLPTISVVTDSVCQLFPFPYSWAQGIMNVSDFYDYYSDILFVF